MSRYKAYPAYKDSGVEWVGRIPKDWDMWKINHACPYVASGTTPTSDSEIYYGGDFPWITTGELRESLITDTQKKVSHRALADMPTLRLHPKGSVAIAMYGATIGRLGILGVNATTNQACCVMPPSKILHNKYLFYWLFATRQEIINLSVGGGQPNVNQEKISSLKVSAPNYFLQEKIAAFLDHETAKIDALIEKQQRLIELLKEKRQAVISHAVTKGINPNAPMKDSGVEWLGEVPAHWDVHAIKHIVSTPITDGPHETPEFFDTGIPFVSAEAVSSGRIDFEKIRAHISEADNQRFSKKYSPKKFDIYMVKSGATTGVTAIVETDDIFNIWSPLAAIRCNELNYPYFVLNFMRSRNFADAIAISWSFGTQQNIGMKVIENLPITRPPLSEAIEIANFLQDKSAKFDKIILQAQAQIDLMQERRTALISAAVTGKIDVRDWQPAAAQAGVGIDG